MKESKMNTLVSDIMGECESIISETENILEELQSESFFFEDEMNTIRYSAEDLQEMVVNGSTLEELQEQSITMYQDCKYILESLETEYLDFITDEVSKSFGYIRASVSIIRDILG
jgi:hypothetical protein